MQVFRQNYFPHNLQIYIAFYSPYEVLNVAMTAPISHTLVHQPYLNEDVPARQKKQFFMDHDKMNEELIQYVTTNGINTIHPGKV